MSSRLDRINALKQATHDYVSKEQTRIQNEVSVLEAILNGRTGGAGIQQVTVQHITEVANNGLYAYLQGG